MKSWSRPLGLRGGRSPWSRWPISSVAPGAMTTTTDAAARQSPDPGYAARDAEVIETGYDGRERYRLKPSVIRQQTESGVIELEHLEMNYHPDAQASCRARRRPPTGIRRNLAPHVRPRPGARRRRRRAADRQRARHRPAPGTGEPLSLTTESLRINTPTEFIETDAPVKLRWSGHELDARGHAGRFEGRHAASRIGRAWPLLTRNSSRARSLRRRARRRVVRRGRRRRRRRARNQEIVLEAKPLEMDYRNNNAVLRDVVITQCDMRIQADRGATSRAGSISRTATWTISGDVRITAEGGSLSPTRPSSRSATSSSRAPPSPARPRSSSSSARTAPPRAAAPTPSTTKPPAAP